jgi:ribonuclease P protein component
VQRLKSRAEFQAVLAGGVISKTPHFALHRLVTDLGSPNVGVIDSGDIWVGAMVPKRWAKRAVTRNMIKRQAYTVLSQVRLPRAAYVVRLRCDFSKAQFVSATSTALKSAVRQELHQLIATTHGWERQRQHASPATSSRQAVL